MRSIAGRIVLLALATALTGMACRGFDASDTPAVDAGADATSTPVHDADAPNPRDATATPVDRAEAYRAAVLADSPLAYWRFDDQPGATEAKNIADPAIAAAADAGIAALKLVASPLIGQPGLFAGGGGSFVFNGADGQRLEAQDLTYLGDRALTFEVWYRPTSVVDTKTRHILWHSKKGDDHAYGVFLREPTGLAVETYDGDTNQLVKTAPPPVGEWHHIVFVSPLTLYLDGVPFTAPMPTEDDGIPETGATPFRIGSKTSGAASIQGALAEVALYDHVLTPARVVGHHDLGRAK